MQCPYHKLPRARALITQISRMLILQLHYIGISVKPLFLQWQMCSKSMRGIMCCHQHLWTPSVFISTQENWITLNRSSASPNMTNLSQRELLICVFCVFCSDKHLGFWLFWISNSLETVWVTRNRNKGSPNSEHQQRWSKNSWFISAFIVPVLHNQAFKSLKAVLPW